MPCSSVGGVESHSERGALFPPPHLPEPLAAVLQQVRTWSGDAARESLVAAGAEQRAAWVVGLQQLADAVSAAALTAVEAFDTAGDGQTLHGAASTPAWLRGALRVTGAEASERTRLARASRDVLADPVADVRAGVITYDHLRAVERGTRQLPDDQRPAGVRLLTELARQASVGDVRTAGQHVRHVVDPDGSLADAEQQHDRRRLTLSPLMDGMTALDGLLDAEAAALLTAALDPFLVPDGAGDARTTPQRRADGLVQVIAAAADGGQLPVSGGQRPHLQLAVDRRSPALVTSTAGVPAGLLPGAPGAPAFLHPAGVGRVACDALLTPLLLDSHGVVVDLGRAQRLFSGAQRRLLAARDGGCRWPGCGRPPAHTDAHHILSWLDGGRTDLTNALLLCRHHHRLTHEGRWRIHVADAARGGNGPVTIEGPNGQRLTSHPRGP